MSSTVIDINRLNASDSDFEDRLATLLQREMIVAEEVTHTVSDILQEVRSRGDSAVVEYTKRFDGFAANSIDELSVSQEQMQHALQSISKEQREALTHAADRIRSYHEKQKQDSWTYTETDGSVYGQKISPLRRVGVYVPGGKANYPSSMLMLAIPAQVAGVKEIIATVPTAYSEAGKLVFAAAALAGVTKLYTIGGAQAVAALAYGTASIGKVDKIAGPGNIYVTVAKKLVFGEVGIDMIAGPSELTIICDGKSNPDWIAMDLFSQAEHDEQAQSILISDDAAFLDEVKSSIDRLLPDMSRRDIISESLRNRGIFILVGDLQEAANVSNIIAPEHLEISIDEPQALLDSIENAGAIFMGRYSAEALGDYCAGPSHVLPTSGSAKFFSALGVYDFQKRSSIINCSESGASALAKTASVIARDEHLEAHALSAEFRLKSVD
ncbi:MAG: histidinol dehydrogenase [Gammaproteobacteria bacterium]|jgi:histidinol dehydrogenase|nr:histidinol dehydrogenase [Pseudomonadales bacterium]MBT5718794.1 histidinol dehydrogenase [Gammaproteobacteria bacterium]MBT6482166.1 histidinol dehydrogenase [Gammaproteobacteria bacterium]